ncbi:MAG: hypothetical protein HY619_00415 [Thaumarchaeota archaeon]|nr:hypothetical protein [Nitrososphaerota archaeon]
MICSVLNVDPLRLISSGALLLAVQPRKENVVKAALKEVGSTATSIGRLVKGKSVLIRGDGSEEKVASGVLDELWRFLQHQR